MEASFQTPDASLQPTERAQPRRRRRPAAVFVGVQLYLLDYLLEKALLLVFQKADVELQLGAR